MPNHIASGGGKRQVIFKRNGKEHKRYVHVDKKGQSYVVYNDKKVLLKNLKIVGDMYMHSESIVSSTSYDSLHNRVNQIYKRRILI